MLEHTTQPTDADSERPMTLIEKLEKLEKEFIVKARNNVSDIMKLTATTTAIGVHKAIEIVKQHSDWISVDERLPDKDGKYLVYCVGNRELTKDRKELSIMRFNQKTKGGWFALSPLFKVVYWQPIQPPSEVQDDM